MSGGEGSYAHSINVVKGDRDAGLGVGQIDRSTFRQRNILALNNFPIPILWAVIPFQNESGK